MDNESIKKTLHELKNYYAAEREKATDIDELVDEPVDREIVIDFWKLSNAEIEREMWDRLSVLDADADCLPGGPISSHRSLLGKTDRVLEKNNAPSHRPHTAPCCCRSRTASTANWSLSNCLTFSSFATWINASKKWRKNWPILRIAIAGWPSRKPEK